MFMRTLPFRGVPPRGSIQDLLAQEMLLRERRKTVSQQSYLGRIIAAGMQLPEATFRLWTSLFEMEIFQENYSPSTVEAKSAALQTLLSSIDQQQHGRVRMFDKLNKLNMSEEDLRPSTAEERERFKRKLRRRHLQTRKS